MMCLFIGTVVYNYFHRDEYGGERLKDRRERLDGI